MRKIKFLYLVVALMLMVSTAAVAAESPNYFRPGTIWIYEASSIGPGSKTEEVSEWTGQEMEIGGFKAMEMWRKYGDGTPRLMTYLRVDGDKVYFLTDKEGSDWRLLYDFSLQSGEDCTVWWFNGSIEYDNISPVAEYLVCDEIMANDCADSVAQMKMLNFHSKDDYENNPDDYLQKSVWLKGVGNDGGPLHTFWGDGIDGVIFRLLLVESEGEVVYRAPGYTGMQGISDARIEVQAGCGEIRVKGADAARVRVFGADGVACRGRDGVYDGLSKGVYLVQVAESTMTVMVR